MSFSTNPLLWKSIDLSKKAGQDGFLAQVAQSVYQIEQYLQSGSFLAGILNGGGLLNPASMIQSSTDLGSPGTSSTVNTNGAGTVFVRVAWTTAANWSLTLNNLTQGAIVYLRLANASGAPRTFTVLANDPSSSPYSVNLFIPAPTVLSSGTSVANNAGINGMGMAATASGLVLDMVGSIG